MYASKRVLQLARACRLGFSVSSRRSVSLGAARLASSWSPGSANLSKTATVSSFPRTPALFFRRGYASGNYSCRYIVR